MLSLEGVREHLRGKPGVAVFTHRDDQPVLGFEKKHIGAVVVRAFGRDAVALCLNSNAVSIVEAADQLKVHLDVASALFDLSSKGWLVKGSAGQDAPIGEVCSEQREAFVDVSVHT